MTPGTDDERPYVLLVEDDDAIVPLIEANLTPAFELLRVGSLAAAEESLAERRPDVVLLDLRLPDSESDDENTLRRLVNREPEAPIVILTSADSSHSLHLLQLGAEDFLRKSEIRFETLARTLRYAMARHSAQQLRRQLEHADRLAVIGRLTAGVAHEINNPASWALGSLEMALDHLDTTEAEAGGGSTSQFLSARYLRDCLERALDGLERVERVVKDLHHFAKPQARGPDVCGVLEAVETALRLTAKELPAETLIGRDIPDDLYVAYDSGRMVQVVVNLVLNARDAIRERKVPVAGRIELEAGRRDSMVWLTVRDNGAGMGRQTLARVFDPFFSTKDTSGRDDRSGTGLGLSICAEILRARGGDIRAESTPGSGTVFEVRMPAAAPPARSDGLGNDQSPAEPLETTQAKPTLADRRLRILVVDDEPRLRELMVSFLSTLGDAVAAKDGDEALRLVAETEARGESFDVLLCDLAMPGLSGPELAQRLPPHLLQRTAFMSGGLYDEELRRFSQTTESLLLEKPIRTAALQEAVFALAKV